MVTRLLASRWVILIAAACAFALTLPSLGNGLEIDDHLYRARVVTDGWGARETALDSITYANPDRPDQISGAMNSGELAWWAAPTLRWRFFRPVAQLTHYAEFRAFGRGGAVWMHLHSVLWMALLAAVVAAFYRQMFGATWIAGLAAILYAVDDGHGFTVGWLANRCTVIATTLGILAVLAHDQWRRRGWKPGMILAPIAFAATLLTSEEAIAICGMIAAYTVAIETVSWRRRAVVIAPYILLVVAWYGAWHVMGYGIEGTGSYTNPLQHPITYLVQGLQRIPILVDSELGELPADLWEVYFVRHGTTWIMVTAGVIVIAILAYAFYRLVRTDRIARFWALAFGFSLFGVLGAHPTDRHLFVVGISGSALVARFLAAWFARRQPENVAVLPRRGAAPIAIAFVAFHLVLAPIALPIRARLPGAVSRGLERIDALVPSDPALAQQTLVLVNVPFKYLCNFASVVRRSNGGVSPHRWACLGVTPGEVAVTRTDARALVLRPADGYLRYFEDTNVRARDVPFAVGDHVELDGVTITIRAVTADARPAEVEYRFAVALEDPSLRWLVWQRGAYQPFTVPAIGTSLELPADAFAFGDLLSAGPR
jgi:hypothetical protein